MNFLDAFIYSNKPWIRILRHFSFWTADMVNWLLVVSINSEVTASRVYRLLLTIPLIALVTYFILYFILPELSKKPGKLRMMLWMLGIVVYIGVAVRYYTYFIVRPLVDPDLVVPDAFWDFRRILGDLFSWASVICMAIAIKLIKSRTELQQKNEQLTGEKKAAELNFLKSQMQPHFLFNTLNTLYSDAIEETGKAQKIVLHLSNLLRFILEECSKPLVPIEKEIKVIEDYIALEKLRHGSRLNIRVDVHVRDKSKLISPLLLLPFVENSCKHTLSSVRGQILIKVKIDAREDAVDFFVENEMDESVQTPGLNHGLGISNVKRQLELLYASDFKLDIHRGNHLFAVHVKIPLISSEQGLPGPINKIILTPPAVQDRVKT